MSNEQKLLHVALEAINALMMGAERYSDNHWGRICMPTDSAMSKGADAAMAIRQALATTEPVMANGLTEAETDASASVVGLTQRVDWFPELEPIGEIVGTRGTPINTPEFWGYFTDGFKTELKLRVVTIEQAKAYGEKCWKAGYKHGAWGDNKQTSKQTLQVEPAVNQQLTTEPVDEREARATLPTQRSSMDGLPKPFGYVSDGFADGLRFQHNPWPVEHTLLHSTMPVFSAAAVQQFKEDAERYRWLASSESNAMDAKSQDHQWAISDAWTTLEKPGADKALIDAAIDAAMAQGVKG